MTTPSTLRRLIGRFRPRRRAALGVFVLLLTRSAFDVGSPLLTAVAIDRLEPLQGKGGTLPAGYLWLLALLAAFFVARNVFWYAAQVAAARLGQDLENELRRDLFRQVLALRFRYHDENQSGKTLARSLRDMEKARHFFREVWFGYVEVALLLVIVTTVVFLTHWTYGLLVVVTFGLGVTFSVLVGRRVARLDRTVSDTYDDVATALQENVAGARVVRAFGREHHEVRKFSGHMDRFSGGWASLERFWTGVMPAVNHLYHLSLPLVVLLGGLRVAAGTGSIGEVAAVLLYVRTVHHRIRPLTRLVILGQQAVASASRVFEVLDRTDRIAAPARPRVLPPAGGHLLLEGVSFGHDPAVPVLRDLSLEIPAGSSLGILGPTGSGKTSLVHLLPRFYDPQSGRILLDGVDLRDLPIEVLRRSVGLVFQEAFLFSGTVASNVAYGRPDLSQEETEASARLAAAHDFVLALPRGYATVIGERGVSLSGGQRQRLTIARALAMDPRVLVFDDATASVDAVTERKLFEGIRRAARGRTTVVVSQRVTSVRWCDRVVLLDQGRVVAEGSHAELLGTSPLYAEIVAHQDLVRRLS